MDIRRLVLYSALAFVVYSLWINWHADYPTQAPVEKTAVTTHDGTVLPHVSESSSATSSQPIVATPQQEVSSIPQQAVKNRDKRFITAQTDVLKVKINLQNGDVVGAKLLDYPVSLEEKNTPFSLLQEGAFDKYVANSSLFTVDNSAIKNLDFDFKASQQHYQLDNQNQLQVVLTGQKDGLAVTKTFTFLKGQYLIKVDYNIQNTAEQPWKGYMNTQLLRASPQEDQSSIFHVGSYTGASYSQPGKHQYEKVSFSQMNKSNLNVDVKGGWIAMQEHYFVTAWVPNASSQNKIYTRTVGEQYIIGSVSNAINIAPGQATQIGSQLYAGPEITSVLKEIAPGLDLTVDYGWLWFISKFLFSVMKAINSVLGNWGWSIVLVTVLIKLAFYRLSATSYKSMAGMRKLQPKIQALKERYGDDKAKMSQATMELYRNEKVNPLGGCLPIIIQIPVFIALYWVLLESVELRQAPFILWIKDLAAADPYHILPIIMGGTMVIQQKLNPAPPDPMQAKIMMFLPVLFTFLFWSFPSGLVLYWIVNNTLSILQQWYITKKYDDTPKKKVSR